MPRMADGRDTTPSHGGDLSSLSMTRARVRVRAAQSAMAAITRRAETEARIAVRLPGYSDRSHARRNGSGCSKNARSCLLDCYARFGVSASCVRVRTRRYSLPNSDNPNLHPMMNEMTNQTAPMIVAIIENILALLECS
jgi:hypothetical protein